ncbi:MAG: Carbon storage regulator [Ktedonobacterales bacterium]|jgi:carbon storage regulator|nr:MAG: Carbon storage regulator [Ktedonobacterales bacterium]
MLVLRRKAGEAIVLNGVITIHVLAVEGERVKLGISAPPEVVIVRSELLENQGHTGAPGMHSAPTPPLQRDSFRPYRAPMREPDLGNPGEDGNRDQRDHRDYRDYQNGNSRYTQRPQSADERPSQPSVGPGPFRYR